MNESYLLDTSAIFALTDNEEGADQVAEFLDRSKRGQSAVHISAMTAMEIYYVSLQERGEDDANRLLLLVRALPLTELSLENDFVLSAARFKARYKISVADCWIAATAAARELTLVHKDPEFELLREEISVLSLPYKSRKFRF